MSDRVVTITGGSGFVGQMLQVGLRQRGYEVRVFDQFRGRRVNLLRRRYLGTSSSRLGLAAARGIRGVQRWLELTSVEAGLLKPTTDSILDLRSRLAARFRGSHAVVHLAGIRGCNGFCVRAQHHHSIAPVFPGRTLRTG